MIIYMYDLTWDTCISFHLNPDNALLKYFQGSMLAAYLPSLLGWYSIKENGLCKAHISVRSSQDRSMPCLALYSPQTSLFPLKRSDLFVFFESSSESPSEQL